MNLIWEQVDRVSETESPVLNQVRSTRVALEEKGGWVSLEIRKVVSDWFKWPEDNLGLAVQAVDSSGKSLIIAHTEEENDGSEVWPTSMIVSHCHPLLPN